MADTVPGKGYITLSVRYQWEVNRLQDALWTFYGYNENVQWVDPSTQHITLVYAENVTNEQLIEAIKPIIGHAAPTVTFNRIGSFPNAESGQQAVYLGVEPNDVLSEIQKLVADALTAQGVEISPTTLPATWVPHTTMFYAPNDLQIPTDAAIDIEAWCLDCVCVQRSDYSCIATIMLTMPTSYSIPMEDGSGPMADSADTTDMPTEESGQVVEMASWKVGAATDLPIVEGDPAWDRAAAVKSMFDACGMGGDSPDTAKIRKGFLLYNASAPKLKGSYKVPIAQMVDGEMKVIPAALRAAASRLPQVLGAPKAAMDKAQKVLDGYKKKAGIGEMADDRHHLIRMTMLSEMKGQYPDVPLPSDINLVDLKEIVGTDKLEFVTLPIGQVNAISGNGRTYLNSAVKEMVDQVNRNRPEGMWGHMTEEEMSTRYDPPSIRWLAAMLDSEGVAWGKGLPLNEMTRNYYRLAKATNARVGTSLTAMAEMDDQDNVLHVELRTIDLADPMRVGVPVTAARPQLTSEMQDVIVRTPLKEGKAPETEQTPTDKTAPVTENKKEKDMLTEAEITELQNQQKTLSEQLALATEQKMKLEARVTELETAEKGYRTEIGVLLAEFVQSEVKRQVVPEDARPLISELVIETQPQSRDEVKANVEKVMLRPSVVQVLKLKVTEQMGGKQVTPDGKTNQGQTPEQKYLNDEPKKIMVPQPEQQEA